MKTSKCIKGPFAKLTNDIAFKWIFGQEANKDILIALLNELIPERRITDVSLFRDSNVPHSKELKKGVFDVSCKTADGSYIDVEVQVRSQKSFADRCLYYSTYNIQGQIEQGAAGYDLKPVYVVSIDDFVRSHGPEWQGEVLTHYSLREDASHELMTDSLHFCFVELPLFKKEWEELDNDKERFYFCFRHLHEMEEIPLELIPEIFAKLVGQARVLEMPPNLKTKYYKNMTTEIDKRAQLQFARDEGVAEGIAKGEAKGRAEGLSEGKAEVARAMLAKDMDPELISEVTGLSAEEIKKLA